MRGRDLKTVSFCICLPANYLSINYHCWNTFCVRLWESNKDKLNPVSVYREHSAQEGDQ